MSTLQSHFQGVCRQILHIDGGDVIARWYICRLALNDDIARHTFIAQLMNKLPAHSHIPAIHRNNCEYIFAAIGKLAQLLYKIGVAMEMISIHIEVASKITDPAQLLEHYGKMKSQHRDSIRSYFRNDVLRACDMFYDKVVIDKITPTITIRDIEAVAGKDRMTLVHRGNELMHVKKSLYKHMCRRINSREDVPTKIYSLLMRYRPLSYSMLAGIQKHIAARLHRAGVDTDLISTPMEKFLPKYYSFYADDREFGSLGIIREHQLGDGAYLAVMPRIEEFIEEMYERIIAAMRRTKKMLVVMILPNWRTPTLKCIKECEKPDAEFVVAKYIKTLMLMHTKITSNSASLVYHKHEMFICVLANYSGDHGITEDMFD